jgi:hypothetical protein
MNASRATCLIALLILMGLAGCTKRSAIGVSALRVAEASASHYSVELILDVRNHRREEVRLRRVKLVIYVLCSHDHCKSAESEILTITPERVLEAEATLQLNLNLVFPEVDVRHLIAETRGLDRIRCDVAGYAEVDGSSLPGTQTWTIAEPCWLSRPELVAAAARAGAK